MKSRTENILFEIWLAISCLVLGFATGCALYHFNIFPSPTTENATLVICAMNETELKESGMIQEGRLTVTPTITITKPPVTVTVTPPPVKVEVPTSTPITLTSFYSAQELDSYLASDNTNLLNFITNQADNGAIINWLYSSRLRLEAVAQGKYIVEENLNDNAYFTWYGQHLPQGVQYFQIDKTYVWGDKGMELWYIDPQTDKHWFVCYLWLNTEDSMIKPPTI